MSTEQKNKIDWAFRNYEKLKSRAKEDSEDLYSSGLTANYSRIGSRSTAILSPVENKVIKKLENDDALWAKLVEYVFIAFHFDKSTINLIRKRYFERSAIWKIANALFMSESTVHSKIKNVRECAYKWACHFGLFDNQSTDEARRF